MLARACRKEGITKFSQLTYTSTLTSVYIDSIILLCTMQINIYNRYIKIFSELKVGIYKFKILT